MPKKLNCILLPIITMLLLCCLAFTGCTEGVSSGQTNVTGECLTSDNSQNLLPEDTVTELTTAHRYSNGKCTICGSKDPSYGERSSSMVWIPTNGGKKYHSHSGCSNMKNPEKVSLSEAQQLGFIPCKKCYE